MDSKMIPLQFGVGWVFSFSFFSQILGQTNFPITYTACTAAAPPLGDSIQLKLRFDGSMQAHYKPE